MVNEKVKYLPLRLKVARIARGFKNRLAFVQFSGVPWSTYNSHETGKYEPRASDIIKYCEIFDISIVWLLTGEGHALDHQEHPNQNEKALFNSLVEGEMLKKMIEN